MRIAVISGKGGTGKTTVAVSIGAIEEHPVMVDCDVDAPNMYLYYEGEDIKKGQFYGSELAVVDKDLCNKCGKCNNVCRYDAIDKGVVNDMKCEGCGACELVCPQKAITMVPQKTADTFITKIPNGIISRAKMDVGSDGSGKLITELRKNAELYQRGSKFTIVDGSPGVGCAVIASITANDAAIIVTEPTKSGMDDFIRVHKLCEHFGIPQYVCINKYDINEDITMDIENYCTDNGITVVGKIPYDETIIRSINELKPIVYYEDSKANYAIRNMWNKVKELVNKYEYKNIK